MKKKQRAQRTSPRCPYCGSHSVLRTADGIYRNNSRNTEYSAHPEPGVRCLRATIPVVQSQYSGL